MQVKEFIGQTQQVKTLNLFIKMAKQEEKELGHVLLDGPAGFGKTSLAKLIAQKLSKEIVILNAASLKTKNDLLAVLTSLGSKVLFLDEIHQINLNIAEELYNVMEQFKINILVGEGINKRAYQLDITPFTLIGASTEVEKLPSPLRDRFVHQIRLSNYTNEELQAILVQSLQVQVCPECRRLLIRASNYVPRRTVYMAQKISEIAKFYKIEKVDKSNIGDIFSHLEVTPGGYPYQVIQALGVLINQGQAKPMGEAPLIMNLGISKKNYLNLLEPFLLKEDLLKKTPQGRVITEKGKEVYKKEKGSL